MTLTTQPTQYLTPEQLASRWQIQKKTLDNWRYQGKGPKYVRIGSRIRYPVDQVTVYEEKLQVA